MDVTIRGTNVKITNVLENYTKTKLSRLHRYLPNISEIRVDLTREHTRRGEDVSIAQITLRHTRGAILRAEEKIRGDGYDTMEAVINEAVDKMYRRIERFKGKRVKNRRGRERFIATLEELEEAEEVPDYEAIAEEYALDYPEGEEEIIRRKSIGLSPMTEDEAISQMELLGHVFFMFLNAETNSINVLYRRSSGGYGVLVPETAS